MADMGGLLKRIKQHDNVAFEELYRQTRHSVYAIIYAIVQDRQDTEDIMQDAYMKMLASLERYDGRSKFKTWLLTIAKNLAIDHYRKHKRLYKVDIQEQEYLFPGTMPQQYKEYESFKYLSLLTEEERTIVLLKVIDNMKHHEIGKLIGKPKGTIMWMYNNALKKMQDYGKEESR